MAIPAPAVVSETCPVCQGSGTERALGVDEGRRVLYVTRCGACGGDGKLPTVPVIPRVVDNRPVVRDFALWPFWIPLALFLIFFLYLWL